MADRKRISLSAAGVNLWCFLPFAAETLGLAVLALGSDIQGLLETPISSQILAYRSPHLCSIGVIDQNVRDDSSYFMHIRHIW